MVSNDSRRKPMRVEVAQWIASAWSKLTMKKIVKTWNIVGHKTGNQENEENDRISVVEVSQTTR
jgi:hypothetical protein